MDFEGAEDLRRAWLSGLAPDPLQTVTQWAEAHRFLSSKGASEAGAYRVGRTPFMREIMDCLSPSHPARRVVFMKGSQVGATEGGVNWIGYCMHRVPGPFLAVQPTVDMAKRFSKQRIDPLIDESPALRDLVLPQRSRDSGNTMLSKGFPGGQLILAGANSAIGLRSMPARFIFGDEIDAYPGDVDGEGDPITLAEARTISFGHRAKMFLASTPTIKGLSRIEREFEMSDQRRFHIPCPLCGGLQWLKFERLKWNKGEPESARYLCEHCEEPFEERFKTQFMDEANGACWLPTADEETQARAAAAGTVGFHISGLYSPLGWYSWRDLARSWEAAVGNEAEIKTLKNTVLGETWQEKGEAPDWQRLYERREAWSLGTVPAGGLILVAGADVQREGRVEVDVWAFGRNMQSWLVDHVVVEGEISGQAVWQQMSELLGRTWPHESGARLGLSRLAIDTGDGSTTDAVYGWVRSVGRGQVLAVKGVGGFDKALPVDGPTFVEVTERGRKIRRGLQLWKVAVAVFKSETYRLLRLPPPTDEEVAEGATWPAGFIHIGRGATGEWFRQLTAEQLVTVKSKQGYPKLEWQKIRDRNEALDCRVYARAAAWVMGADRWDESRWDALQGQLVPEAEVAPAARPAVVKPAARPPAAKAKKADWFGGSGKDWF